MLYITNPIQHQHAALWVHIIIIIIIHEFHRDASLEQNFRAAALHGTKQDQRPPGRSDLDCISCPRAAHIKRDTIVGDSL